MVIVCVEKLDWRTCYVTFTFSPNTGHGLCLFSFCFLPFSICSSFFVLRYLFSVSVLRSPLTVPCSRSPFPVFRAVPLLFVCRSLMPVLYFKFPVLFPVPFPVTSCLFAVAYTSLVLYFPFLDPAPRSLFPVPRCRCSPFPVVPRCSPFPVVPRSPLFPVPRCSPFLRCSVTQRSLYYLYSQ